MSVFTRPDSKFYYLYLEPIRKRVKTTILAPTPAMSPERQAKFQAMALDLYHREMAKIAVPRTPKPRRPRKRCYVYFLSDGEMVKIGRAWNVAKRIRSLQTSHAKQLTLLLSFPAPAEDERLIHQRFDHLRVRGEWFRAEQELTAYIELVRRSRRRP